MNILEINDNIHITLVEPEMFDLVKIVIPKIMNEWEYIAEALRYDLAIIEAIKESEREDPKKCCRELFMDWLSTNNGAKAGPKVWSTLLDVLKEVDEIPPGNMEDIIAHVGKIGEGHYEPKSMYICIIRTSFLLVVTITIAAVHH